MDDLRKLQLIELSILKEFILICEKHNLRYYAAGGTVLGAVRHKGFIPWDDDIDVAMPREDYEKFLSISDKIRNKNFSVSTVYNNENHYTPFIQVFNPQMSIVIKNAKITKNSFCWMDIFPIDGLPDLSTTRFVHTRRFLIKRALYHFSVFKEAVNQNKVRPFCEKVIIWICNHIDIQKLFNQKKRLDACDKLVKKYSFYKTQYCMRTWSQYRLRALFPTSYFGKGAILKFEDIDIVVPQNYDGYLKQLFGDYMKEPPVDKRSWHDTEILS